MTFDTSVVVIERLPVVESKLTVGLCIVVFVTVALDGVTDLTKVSDVEMTFDTSDVETELTDFKL